MSDPNTDKEIREALRRAEVHIAAEQPREALAELQKVMQVAPGHPEAMRGVGCASILLGDPNAALQALDHALAAAPGMIAARNARGIALQDLGRYDEAEGEFRRVVEAQPDDAGAVANLASALVAIGRFDEARPMFETALALRPDDATAGYNLGLLDLLRGDFKTGWQGYELRSRAGNVNLAACRSTEPRWTGEPRPDATLLIHAEQGLGDNIQFARYVELAAERVGKVVLEVPEPLAGLFSQIAAADKLVRRDQPLPAHDFHIPIMSLPVVFETDEGSIPWPGPYLAADPARAGEWRRRLERSGSGRHVGLVWSGNPEHKRDRERSLPLSVLEPLLRVEGVTLHALQIGPAAEDLAGGPFKGRMKRLFPRQYPLEDVAATIAALDLVIGVDTSLVHLAGALGRPVWTLITYVPDWRWMLGRTDSPWYPTMRLFRQPARGDWVSVVAEVARELRVLGANGGA